MQTWHRPPTPPGCNLSAGGLPPSPTDMLTRISTQIDAYQAELRHHLYHLPQLTADQVRLQTSSRKARAGQPGWLQQAIEALRHLTKFLLVVRSLAILILLWSAILAGTYNAKTIGMELGDFLRSLWQSALSL